MTAYIIGMDLGDFVLIVLYCIDFIFFILLTLCIWFYIFKPLGMESEYGSQEIIEMESMSISELPLR